MPTPEQFAAWAAEADAILAGRSLSDVDEGTKAAVFAIRSMGPDAAKDWIQQNAAFANPSPTVLDANNVPVLKSSLPQAQQDYYTRIDQQNKLDAESAASALAKASSGPSAAPAPDAASDFANENPPPAVGVVGSMASGIGTGGLVVTSRLSPGVAPLDASVGSVIPPTAVLTLDATPPAPVVATPPAAVVDKTNATSSNVASGNKPGAATWMMLVVVAIAVAIGVVVLRRGV